MKILWITGWIGVLLSISPVFAAIDAYDFRNPAEEQRFRALIDELRCPKCQNQTIADSNAPLSKDLRQRVYEMMQNGRSNEEIVEFLVARYGDFITYRPPLTPLTWLLWFGPVTIMVLIAVGLGLWIRRRGHEDRLELDEEERRRLQSLLTGHKGSR